MSAALQIPYREASLLDRSSLILLYGLCAEPQATPRTSEPERAANTDTPLSARLLSGVLRSPGAQLFTLLFTLSSRRDDFHAAMREARRYRARIEGHLPPGAMIRLEPDYSKRLTGWHFHVYLLAPAWFATWARNSWTGQTLSVRHTPKLVGFRASVQHAAQAGDVAATEQLARSIQQVLGHSRAPSQNASRARIPALTAYGADATRGLWDDVDIEVPACLHCGRPMLARRKGTKWCDARCAAAAARRARPRFVAPIAPPLLRLLPPLAKGLLMTLSPPTSTLEQDIAGVGVEHDRNAPSTEVQRIVGNALIAAKIPLTLPAYRTPGPLMIPVTGEDSTDKGAHLIMRQYIYMVGKLSKRPSTVPTMQRLAKHHMRFWKLSLSLSIARVPPEHWLRYVFRTWRHMNAGKKNPVPPLNVVLGPGNIELLGHRVEKASKESTMTPTCLTEPAKLYANMVADLKQALYAAIALRSPRTARLHCGRDPSVVGCCGGADDNCDCECNTCSPTDQEPSWVLAEKTRSADLVEMIAAFWDQPKALYYMEQNAIYREQAIAEYVARQEKGCVAE